VQNPEPGNGSIATNVGGDHNEITAKGSQFTVTPSGTRTFDIQASKLARGQFALQYSAGVVKFPQGGNQAAIVCGGYSFRESYANYSPNIR
jgi:hypothetical protein